MQPIEIEPNHFINKDHIVEFIYKPSTAHTEKVHDETDPDVSKTTWVTVESSLTIKLSDSRTIAVSGAPAERIYSGLKSLVKGTSVPLYEGRASRLLVRSMLDSLFNLVAALKRSRLRPSNTCGRTGALHSAH